MREILFRGKRIDNGEWTEGSLLQVSVASKTYTLIFGDRFSFNGRNMKALEHALIDPSTIGQYTGIDDKNGKRIFEGDIVCEEGTFFSIAWVDSWYGFAALMVGTMDRFSIEELGLLSIKVIGNIHDNPELLKESEA